MVETRSTQRSSTQSHQETMINDSSRGGYVIFVILEAHFFRELNLKQVAEFLVSLRDWILDLSSKGMHTHTHTRYCMYSMSVRTYIRVVQYFRNWNRHFQLMCLALPFITCWLLTRLLYLDFFDSLVEYKLSSSKPARKVCQGTWKIFVTSLIKLFGVVPSAA